MGDKSKIEWCDATWNPITGCTPVSAGCANCYAARMAKRFPKAHGPAPWNDVDREVQFSDIIYRPDRIYQPLRWKRPRRIFVCSMGDLFHEDVSVTAIMKVFEVMWFKPQHTFMLLTKRPERMRAILSGAVANVTGPGTPPAPNIWLGITAENQEMADQRIPILLDTPAAVRFVSVEPMLGPVNLSGFMPPGVGLVPRSQLPNWIICGGESGPGARPMHPDWPRSLRDQCQAAGVPFFFKQWGEWGPHRAAGIYRDVKRVDYIDGVCMLRIGKKAAGCLLDGREHKEFPEVKG